MNKIVVVILCLSLVFVLSPIASTNPDHSTYDPMADVNRDGIVDANDLSRLGKAYGSAGLIYQENKTVIAVYNETSPIENARVAIVGNPWAEYPDTKRVLQIACTNSSGIAAFALSNDTNYVCLAWSGSRYNYVNFTTDSYSDASITMLLDAGRKSLPYGWVVFTLINKTSGELVTHPDMMLLLWSFRYDPTSGNLVEEGFSAFHRNPKGVSIGWGDWGGYNLVGKSVEVIATYPTLGHLGPGSCFMPDENGNANVVIYVD